MNRFIFYRVFTWKMNPFTETHCERWTMNRFTETHVWKMKDDSVHLSPYVTPLFTWIGSPSVPIPWINHILMTSLCPSNGAVNRFTRTNGREWEPWTDSPDSVFTRFTRFESRDRMAWKIIHVNTPVNGFTWKSLRLFTAFHGLSRPSCVFLWIDSPVNRFTVCLRP